MTGCRSRAVRRWFGDCNASSRFVIAGWVVVSQVNVVPDLVR